jgi:hypothetical protein
VSIDDDGSVKLALAVSPVYSQKMLKRAYLDENADTASFK